MGAGEQSWDVGAAPFSPFPPAASIATGAEDDADAEQQHRVAGWGVGVRAEHKILEIKWCNFESSNTRRRQRGRSLRRKQCAECGFFVTNHH